MTLLKNGKTSHLLLLLVWILLLSFLFAQVEIQIEGPRGWAAGLPTWRIEKHWLLDLFWGGRPLTGYHAWIFSFMFLVFLFPLVLSGGFSLKRAARCLGSLMLFWIIEDFLWFALNPAFGLARFSPMTVPWHHHWFVGLPVDYYIFLLFGGALLGYSFTGKSAADRAMPFGVNGKKAKVLEQGQGVNDMPRHSFPAEKTVRALRDEIAAIFGLLDSWCARSPEELDLVPKDVGWNIRLILEHISLVNHYLLLTLGKGVRLAVRRAGRQPIPAGESDLTIFAEIADPDAFDWEPPKHMIPTGLTPLDEVRELLEEQRGECLCLLEKMARGEGFLHTVHMSVQNLGRLDMYQWLWFLLMHARRHLTQMLTALKDDGTAHGTFPEKS